MIVSVRKRKEEEEDAPEEEEEAERRSHALLRVCCSFDEAKAMMGRSGFPEDSNE